MLIAYLRLMERVNVARPTQDPRRGRAFEARSEIGSQLARRRSAVASAWDLSGGELVLIGAGGPIPIPGRPDGAYPFRPHPEYFYLTDRSRPGGVLLFDPDEGWIEFLEPITREELLWSAADDLQEGVPDGARSIEDLPSWLEAPSGRRLACLGAPSVAASSDPAFDEDLRYALMDVRRVKDEVELQRMRVAERASRSGFVALQELISEGRTERELQIELEAQFFRAGADGLAYDTVVASGAHSAVLHFAPTARQLAAEELVLVDAGGEYRGYASDITRTYPVSGSFTAEQEHLYGVVRQALDAAIQACRPGVEWREVHRLAALVIADGLADLGILHGEVESLFEQGAVSLFFPHGVGHMVGLGVRDASGALRHRDKPGPGFPRLRVDLPIRVGYTMTVEPGIYFVPAMLADQESRKRLGEAVHWDRVDELLHFGGIRLEQNVLIIDDGCEVLTADVPLLP